MTALGIPIHDSEAEDALTSARKDDFEYFVEKGYPPEQLRNAIREAKEHKGFLLGFSPAIKELELLEGDIDGGDMRIRTGEQGLPYQYISGIQPLGSKEVALLEEWGVIEKQNPDSELYNFPERASLLERMGYVEKKDKDTQ